jgi:RNA recognition motif-containing protein
VLQSSPQVPTLLAPSDSAEDSAPIPTETVSAEVAATVSREAPAQTDKCPEEPPAPLSSTSLKEAQTQTEDNICTLTSKKAAFKDALKKASKEAAKRASKAAHRTETAAKRASKAAYKRASKTASKTSHLASTTFNNMKSQPPKEQSSDTKSFLAKPDLAVRRKIFKSLTKRQASKGRGVESSSTPAEMVTTTDESHLETEAGKGTAVDHKQKPEIMAAE